MRLENRVDRRVTTRSAASRWSAARSRAERTARLSLRRRESGRAEEGRNARRPARSKRDRRRQPAACRARRAHPSCRRRGETVCTDRWLRLARLAVTANVGRDGVVAALGERLQLMATRIPGFRKAMAKEHDRPLSGLSARWIGIPFASTVRWAISVNASSPMI
jgi:hypothetical protein